MTVSTSRKKLSSKVTVSIREKTPSPIAEMKDTFENTFPLDRKKSLPQQESLKKYKKWFVLARKSVSTTRNEAVLEKYISTIWKNCFFWQESQRKWFPLAGKWFSYGFQHQKKTLNKSILFPLAEMKDPFKKIFSLYEI